MKAYVSIMEMRFMQLLQYRVAAGAGMVTQFLFGLVRVMVFAGFYGSSSQVQPMSFAETVSYVWIGQAMLGLLPWNSDSEIQNMIKNGNVAYELCRPVDLYGIWYFRAVALRSAPTLLKSVPILLVTMLALPSEYRLQPPPSLGAFVGWLLTVIGAVLLGAAITNLITISQIWTLSGEGVNRLVPALVIFFSGIGVPIPLFPDWMQGFLYLLPFRGIIDTPTRIFIGHVSVEQIGAYLAHQLIWTIILALLGHRLLQRGLSRVVIQGG